MPSLDPVLEAYQRFYPDPSAWTPPFRLLGAVKQIREGASPEDVAKAQRIRLPKLIALLTGDPVAAVFGCTYADAGPENPKSKLAKRGLGQMVLGHVAEQVFERLYKREIGTNDLILEDSRQDRNDTDYRVLNGNGHPVFRINIKSHGTQFRRAKELVGLDPEDCFALGTYKIWQGLNKEKEERLPYIFMVVTVPNLTGETIGQSVPDDVLRLATVVRASKGVNGLKKRDMEDQIVTTLVGPNAPESFVTVRDDVLQRLEAADWRVLSAYKANVLLRELLWERVYAVKVRGFAQNYRNAELDMHFSLSKDMTTLHDFLQVYKDGGLHLLMSQMSRGDI